MRRCPRYGRTRGTRRLRLSAKRRSCSAPAPNRPRRLRRWRVTTKRPRRRRSGARSATTARCSRTCSGRPTPSWSLVTTRARRADPGRMASKRMIPNPNPTTRSGRTRREPPSPPPRSPVSSRVTYWKKSSPCIAGCSVGFAARPRRLPRREPRMTQSEPPPPRRTRAGGGPHTARPRPPRATAASSRPTRLSARSPSSGPTTSVPRLREPRVWSTFRRRWMKPRPPATSSARRSSTRALTARLYPSTSP